MRRLVFLWFLAAVACTPVPAQEKELPPLPREIIELLDALGEPDEIHPGVSMTLVWRRGREALHVLLIYDPIRGWCIDAYTLTSEGMPAQWVAELMVRRAEERKRQEAQTPGEGW